MAEALRLKLEKIGCSVSLAPSGVEAKEILEKEHFDLILTDLMMPKFNGFQLLEFIQTQKIATPDKVKSYLVSGVNEFYIKANYRLDQIIGDITNHLTTSEK